MMNINISKSKWLYGVFFFCLSLLIFSFFNNSKHTLQIHVQNHIQLIAKSTCKDTLYPQLCSSTISTAFQDLNQKSLPEIISGIINTTISEVHTSEIMVIGIIIKERRILHPIDRLALDDCVELLQDTASELREALYYLSSEEPSSEHKTDLNMLFSAAMTNQYTCLDGFSHGDKILRSYIQGGIERIIHHLSNSLAILTKVKNKAKKKKNVVADVAGKDFQLSGTNNKDRFPTWLKKKDRALLQAPVNEIKFDLVVAKDGSGNFTTINEALETAPNNSATRFVIYIKKGKYYEYVEVVNRKRNIMFVGDGIEETWIKGNRSVGANYTTFHSHTVAVMGEGFIGRGISFENFAGPSMRQAVALRSSSDFSAFYNCSFLAYQDTLYVHRFRQFYTHCDIYGTIDFIFGNAAVVLQRCNLYARRPNPNQRNVYTAQSRTDPNENTGISIINCKVTASADLIPVQSSFRTFLGRPWRIYARTVFLLSYLDDLIEPRGWLEWNGNLGLDTLYYGEYENRGPGSDTSRRVDWPGFRVITNSTEASEFTVANLIEGERWLPETGFPFYLDLIPPS